MCDSGPALANVKSQIKEATTGKRVGQNLLTGGVGQMVQVSDNSKVLDSLGRKQMLIESREAGVLPEKRVKVDPAVERANAEAKATQDANARIALQRRAMRENSLLTGGGGRATLGV
jgi:hypothetical protein